MKSREEYKIHCVNQYMEEIKNHGYLYRTIVEMLQKAYEDGFKEGYDASQDDYYA